MEKKIFLYLRFKPTEKPDKRLISEISACPFDYIFTPTASQEEVFTKFKYVSDLIKLGKNPAIIVVGDSESGRRHSLFGRFPAHNGILPRIVEEIVQLNYEVTYKVFLTATNVRNEDLLQGIKSNSNRRVNFESNLLDIIQNLNNLKMDQTVIYKLIFQDLKKNKENEVVVLQIVDSDENLSFIFDLLNNSERTQKNALFSALESCSESTKISVLFTAQQDHKKIEKIRAGFSSKDFSEEAQSTESSGNESLKQKIKILEQDLSTLNQKLIDSELKGHEYYECYHKALMLINKDSAQNIFLNSQNESLIRQIRKETSILQSLESKFQSLFDNCAKSHESTHLEFDSLVDSIDDKSFELNATDTLNLGISQVKLNLIPDPSAYAPYSEEIKQALEGNSEFNKEVQILQLKNQLIEASVINANLSRMLSSLDWKLSMIKHRYEMKRLLSKQQQERIKSLEEMVEFLSISFHSLKQKIVQNETKEFEKLFEKYCYKSIIDSQRLVAEYKRSISTIEAKVTESYKKEAQKWMDLLQEHKENYEKELKRKQSEVIRLNELLGKWINKYMELQENLNTNEKPLNMVYYNEMQALIHETIKKPSQAIAEKQMTPKAKRNGASQKFGVISGDINPPI